MGLPTGKQITAARALAGWTVKELAQKVELSDSSISKIENGDNRSSKTLEKIELVFALAGIEFIEGEGVRRRQAKVRTLEGQIGYWEFYDDVYETVKRQGGEILVSNVDETLFSKWLGDRGLVHKTRMYNLSKERSFSLKILVQEGDVNFTVPEYAQYRWTPKDRFSEIPFYVYGGKLAILLFEDENVSVFIVENAKIAQAYKTQFQVMWDQAIIIPADRMKVAEGLEIDE